MTSERDVVLSMQKNIIGLRRTIFTIAYETLHFAVSSVWSLIIGNSQEAETELQQNAYNAVVERRSPSSALQRRPVEDVICG
jgi:hypothetical protein